MIPFETHFLSHRGRLCSKWQHYFKIYDRHLGHLIGKNFTLLEIGIAGGGSLQLWRAYFGEKVSVAGIDIDPKCQYREPQIETFTGSQTDTEFLNRVVNTVGQPTVIIDDGSHVQSDVLATFDHLYPLLPSDGIYIIEDCHTSYWPRFQGGLNSHLNVVDIMSRNVHDVNTKWFNLPRHPKMNNLNSIHFYDSMIVFEKKPTTINRYMVDADANGARIMETI